MDKRQREQAILRMVYDESKFAQVKQRENPDFSLRYASVDQPFGVEVTELYYSESDARAKNIPRYTSDLLDGAEHRHRDDIEVLKVVRVKIVAPDGTEKASDVPAVMRELPPVDAYARKLAGVIERKSARVGEYTRDGLSHVNLIVLDRENRLSTASPEYLFAHIFVPELVAVLYGTPFREVFFITKVVGERRVFLPLRMVLLLAELFFYDGALSEFRPGLQFSSPQAELRLFAEFARMRRMPAALALDESGELEVVLGNSGIRLSEELGIGVYDHADLPLPALTSPDGTSENASCLDSEFVRYYEDFRARNTFTSGLAFDVRAEAPV